MFGRISLWAAGAVVAGLMLPSEAMAQYDAQTRADLNLRVGPGTEYGVIDVIPAGYPVDVLGCLDAYEWCDIEWDGLRGWVSARYLVQPQTQVYLPQYAPRIGVPIISFSFGAYHDRYYRDRPWYRERRGGWDYGDWRRDRDRDRRRGGRDRDRDRDGDRDQARDRDRDRDGADRREQRQEAEQPRQEREARPQRQEREARPQRQEREASPQRQEREARPQRQEREARPQRQEREARPQRQEREAQPRQGERTQRQGARSERQEQRQGQRNQRQGNQGQRSGGGNQEQFERGQ